GELWTTVLDVLEREGTGPPAVILRALHPWVYPSTLAFGRGVDEEAKAAILEVTATVISRLSWIFRNRPGALRQLRDDCAHARLDVPVDVPIEFDTLFPADWDGKDEAGGHQRWDQAARDAVRTLAASWEGMPAEEIAARIATAD